MNPLHLLKQLRKIEPDPGFSRRSRNIVLRDVAPRVIPSFGSVIREMFQTGFAVIFAGILLVILAGGFSAWKFLSPLHLSSLDPAGLKAEAQAIDIQIQLTNFDYPEPAVAETTIATTPDPVTKRHTAVTRKIAEELGVETAASTSITIEDALDELAE